MNSQMPDILIVESEVATQQFSIKKPLKLAGFETVVAHSIHRADMQIAATTPKIILLDSQLLGQNSIAYIKKLRAHHETCHIPILLITPTADSAYGADDYIVTPYSALELVAKINALLQHGTSNTSADIISIKQLTIHLNTRRVSIGGSAVKLTPMPYELLVFFVSHPNEIYSRQQLSALVWGGKKVSEHAIDVHIRKLRRILRMYGYDTLIQTVHRVGFRCCKTVPPFEKGGLGGI